MLNLKKLIPCFLVFLLIGCETNPIRDNLLVEIAQGVSIELMPVQSTDNELMVLQDVIGKYDKKEYRFISQMELHKDAFVVVGVSPVGKRLFSIELKNGVLHSEVSELMPENFNPAYVMADIQLAHWPVESVKNSLRGGDIKVVEVSDLKNNSKNKPKRLRQIWHNGKKIIEVEYQNADRWSSLVIYEHIERAYSVTSRMLETSKL